MSAVMSSSRAWSRVSGKAYGRGSWARTVVATTIMLAGSHAHAAGVAGQVAAVPLEAAVTRADRLGNTPIPVQARPMGELRAAADDAPAVARITLGTGRTTFEGTGLQGTLVELSESGQLIGVAPVDSAGRWVLTVDRPLSAGDHRISTSASDPARARVAAGQDVLLSIPEGFTGTTILSQRSPTSENVAPGSQLRRPAEQSATADERFSEVMSSPEWRRIARASGEPAGPASRPAGGASATEVVQLAPVTEDGGLAQFYGWFDRASRDYHEQVVKRLADPRPLPSEGIAATRTETSSVVLKPLVPPPQPETSSGAVSVQSPPATTPKLGPSPSELSVLDSLRDMLDRASRDYREGVIRKLAQPAETAVPSGPPLGPAGPANRVGDAREAEALRRADEDRRAAQARRQAETQPKTDLPTISEMPAPTEDRAAIEARRLEAEQKIAAARRADEERRAEEARLEGLRRQADAAKRTEDEKRAAEQAKADEVRRSLEAAQRDAQRSGQEAADRQRQAALDEAQRKAQDAQRAQEAIAAATARKAQEEAERQRAEAQRVAVAKAAEDERRRADDERRRSAAAARPAPQAVAPSTPKASGFRTEDEYRRAMAEAARAPKASTETVPPRVVEGPTQPQAAARSDRPPSRDGAVTAPRVPATGFRTQEDYRRAMVEASRAPKVGPAGFADVAPSQPKARSTTRAEAEKAARAMLQAERVRLAELKLERSRTDADRKRADGVRGPNATPRLIEPGQQNGRGSSLMGEQASATKAATASAGSLGGASPGPRKEQRRVAECPAAGRRVSLPGAYIVKSGDTLWNIAARFYSDGEAYQRILKANKGKVPNPDFIEPCLKLTLPRR